MKMFTDEEDRVSQERNEESCQKISGQRQERRREIVLSTTNLLLGPARSRSHASGSSAIIQPKSETFHGKFVKPYLLFY